MSRQCVYCGNQGNLNTQMTIIADDGKKHTVDICDQHSEDATVKSAREAFQNKKKQIDDLLVQAKALGLDISQTSSGLSIAAQPPREQQVTSPSPIIDKSADDVISTDRLDRNRGMVSVGGQTEMGQIASHSSYDPNSLTDKLPDDVRKGLAKMTVVEGRGGQPLVIAKQRVDGTGTTNVMVSKTENDQTLQSRFKRMADASMQDNVPNFARQGYQNTTVSCTFCTKGFIKTKGGDELCPKCKGSGILPRY